MAQNTPSEKKITIVPRLGLCNRLRALSSAYYLARHYGAQLEVYWEKNKDCNAYFEELFQNTDALNIAIHDQDRGWLYRKGKFYNLYLPVLRRHLYYDQQIINLDGEDTDIFGVIKPFSKIYIRTCHALGELYPLTEIFKPVKEIQDRIDAIVATFPAKTIGIHIRRTDNRMSISHNSPQDFIGIINKEILANPDVCFYLATDDLRLKEEIIKTFGNRINYFDATLNRDSVEGMKDAVTDLWCLSKTTKIIGSFFSSYSDIASKIGNIPLEIPSNPTNQ